MTEKPNPRSNTSLALIMARDDPVLGSKRTYTEEILFDE